jgi:hypothetical protein
LKFRTYQLMNQYDEPAEWVVECWTTYPWLSFGGEKEAVEKWCRETFGPGNWRDVNNDLPPRWSINAHDSIIFRDKKDLDWFALRWGS